MTIFRIVLALLPSLLIGRLDQADESSGSTVYFVEVTGIDMDRVLYDPIYFRDEVPRAWFCLREAIEKAGYKIGICNVQCTDRTEGSLLKDVAVIISINEVNPGFLNNLYNYPKEKMILIELDPPVILPALHDIRLAYYFRKIFTLFDDKVDNKQFFRLNYPQPRMDMIEGVPDFDQKKFCTMINRNHNCFIHPKALYPKRREAIAFFSNATDEFDLYGGGWEGYPAWRGAVPAKWEVLKNYKFCICYENMGEQVGYISEKIFDCFTGGCVPIYLGATNITDYVPKECFIDRRDFASDQELYDFLRAVDRESYEGYIEAIRKFQKSPAAYPFTKEYLVEVIMNEIRQICPSPL